MVNNPALRKSYWLWASALLLLTLGKVYEWAYPGFQHDYRHFVRNQLNREIKEFVKAEAIQRKTLDNLLPPSDSLSYNHTRFIHYLIHDTKMPCIVSKYGTILYWSGEETFLKSQWVDSSVAAGFHIIKHREQYYILKKTKLNQFRQAYDLIQYQVLNSVRNAYHPLNLITRIKDGNGLLVPHPEQPKKALAILQCDADFLAPVYGNLLIIFYFLVLMLFYYPVHNVSKYFYNQNNFPWGNLFLITGVLVTASMCQWIVHQNDFYHSVLTDKLIKTKFYDYTLFEFSVFTCLFFHLSYFFYKYATLSPRILPALASSIIVLFNYLTAFFFLMIYCFLFYAVFVRSEYYFDLNNIFSLNVQHFILLFDLMVSLLAIFLITNKLTASTYSFQLEFRKRFLLFLLAAAISIPFIIQSQLQIHAMVFLLGASIIIWMQDFFMEDYQKNILWLISWIIVISILSSSLIFHFQNEKRRYVKEQLVKRYTQCLDGPEPDCLTDLIQNCSTNNFDFYYYDDRLLKFSSNVYKPNYSQSLNYLHKDSIKHIRQNNKDVLLLRPKKSQLLIITNPIESSLNGISLFSYLFTLLIVLSYIISLIHQRYPFLPEDLQISFPDRPSLKNRIQFYVILGIVISFLIIALTTVFFTRRSENQIYRENLVSKTSNLSSFLESSIRNAPHAEEAKSMLQNQIKQSSQMVDFEIKVYNNDGLEQSEPLKLAALSDVSHLLNPTYFFQYPNYSEDIVVLNKNSNPDEFLAYRNIFYNNQRISVIQVEAVASKELSYNTRLANLVNTLLNIYVFLFLIAASLATFLANSITSPLVNLTDKLRSIRLGKTNEVLEWKSEDEIGELIRNYNQMVNQLDESARLLARNERDSAWREMAKQVAHEIKNPLTPMKLSIQYLQQTLRTGSEDIKDMAQKVCATLIEQINSLSKIATEFSNFAKMPQAQSEKLILNEIVSSAHDLFRKRDDIDIHLTVPIDELYVYADKDQILRVLNNLINNAIQAIPDDRRGQILISLDSNQRNAIICVRDNGSGIPEELQPKVFLPNFTSKSSGTGLGLAMCQQIIEAANGKIYFKTVPGKGTGFFVELPLMKKMEEDQEEETNA